MEESDNKSIVCSILFLEIVGYSKKPVMGQIALRDRINSYLAAAIRDVPIADRIIFDTGDGLVINFLGDVEDALKAALGLQASLLNEEPNLEPPLRVRMGINLGPVRLVRDANGQPNIVGDGINVAQRVMGFADEEKILVSRSYYDAVSRLSPQYAGMFQHQGSRTDKHVREHEIFSIARPDRPVGTPEQISARPETAGKVNAWLRATPMPKRVLYAGLLIVPVILFILLPAKVANHDKTAIMQPAAIKKPDDTAQPATATDVKPPVVVAAPSADATAKAATKSEPRKAAAARETGVAQVKIVVLPWGEIYLDGKMQGISPPLAELNVPQGQHKIEIRNTSFPAYTQSIKVQAGDKIKIKHKFAN